MNTIGEFGSFGGGAIQGPRYHSSIRFRMSHLQLVGPTCSPTLCLASAGMNQCLATNADIWATNADICRCRYLSVDRIAIVRAQLSGCPRASAGGDVTRWCEQTRHAAAVHPATTAAYVLPNARGEEAEQGVICAPCYLGRVGASSKSNRSCCSASCSQPSARCRKASLQAGSETWAASSTHLAARSR